MTAVEKFIEQRRYTNTYRLQQQFPGKWGYTLYRLERQHRIFRLNRGILEFRAMRGDEKAREVLKAHPRAQTFWALS